MWSQVFEAFDDWRGQKFNSKVTASVKQNLPYFILLYLYSSLKFRGSKCSSILHKLLVACLDRCQGCHTEIVRCCFDDTYE